MAERCPLCRERKGKRACPAKGEMICAHCCGTKRLVEIDCPQSCVYLTGAHAPAWEGRETEKRRDARRVLPYMQELSEPQARLFFLTLVGVQAIRARRPDLEDTLLAEAIAALRRTVETRTRGVLYEHQAQDARAQGLIMRSPLCPSSVVVAVVPCSLGHMSASVPAASVAKDSRSPSGRPRQASQFTRNI